MRVKTAFIKSNESTLRRIRTRRAALCAAAALPLGALLAGVQAQTLPPAQAFVYLHPAFTQELIVTEQLGPYPGTEHDTEPLATVLGGIAFAPDGDVWAANCVDGPSVIHRFDIGGTRATTHGTATLRPKLYSVPSDGGCGLVNHPVGGAMYMNSSQGVRRLSAVDGTPMTWPNSANAVMGPAGNTLGIAVDPMTEHLVYAGDDCDDRGPASATCTLWDIDPSTGDALVFGQFPHDEMPFVDGIYFDPEGGYLFVANRTEQHVVYGQGQDDYHELNRLTIVRRPAGSLSAQIVRHLPMTAEPDGVSFHRNPDFVITNNEDGFSMTRFDFPEGFESLPTQLGILVVGTDAVTDEEVSIQTYGVDIATGGHRGDLSQVGPDGCIYATQGRDRVASAYGTRYNDGTETREDSIVKICMADGSTFEPPPGVRDPLVQGSVAGSAYLDLNGNNAVDEGVDQFLPGVTITLSGGTTSLTTSTSGGPAPAYSFSALNPGTYSVGAPSTSGGYTLVSPASLTATISSAGENVTRLDFLYKPGKISGTAYLDVNDSGGIDGGDTKMSGVPVVLSNGATTASTNGTPGYTFPALAAGSYGVTAPSTAQGYLLIVAPPPHTLGEGEEVGGLDFLYKAGKLSGYAYVDANGNDAMDSGEIPLAHVLITGPGGATRVTDGSGFYAFTGLPASSPSTAYSVAAPSNVGTYTLGTPASLAAPLPAGGSEPNLNFGYDSPPPQPGSISGKTYIDANLNGQLDNGETVIGGVAITLSGSASGNATTTAASGYNFANLATGTYNIGAAPTATYNGAGYNLVTPSPLSVTLTAGENRQNVNFGYFLAYVTYTQGGWGATPAGNNPGTVLANNFGAVFPNGVVVGWASKYTLKFTSASAIRNFLPAGGAPKALKVTAINPTTSAAGVFAGQVLAAKLSVSFSAAGITTPGLGSLKVAAGYPLAGETVSQVLALAEKALGGGGLPSGVSFSVLNDVVTRINENFDNGTTNNGFLVP